ncbi:hypothetical protein AB0I00_17910 [Streptomyces sp. NPDC050803]|uniref:hypothetical protein n=1 Tax=unclassified Streptomyces TaxID=2593676 RepID=UPI003436C17C
MSEIETGAENQTGAGTGAGTGTGAEGQGGTQAGTGTQAEDQTETETQGETRTKTGTGTQTEVEGQGETRAGVEDQAEAADGQGGTQTEVEGQGGTRTKTGTGTQTGAEGQGETRAGVEDQAEAADGQGGTQTEAGAEAGADDQTEVPPGPPAHKPRRRGRIAAVAGSLLLAGALVAGVGYTVVTVRDADRDAGAPVWKLPADKSGEAKGAAASGLAGMLVPYGTDGWTRGPDVGEFGSDAELSGGRATALEKQSLRELPRPQRQELEKQIDKQRITGMAIRSYVSDYEGDVAVNFVLAQMENRDAVRDTATFRTELFDAFDVFRDGPKIKGHKNARCYLSPEGEGEDLDYLFCSAYEGNVLITASAYGVGPLAKEVAMLFTEQLDRITEPGKAV